MLVDITRGPGFGSVNGNLLGFNRSCGGTENGGGERRRRTGRQESEVKKRKSTSEKVRYAIGT